MDKFFQPKNNKKSKKLPEIDIKSMGVDIDKNEYREIVLSNSAHPENCLGGTSLGEPW